MIEHKYKAVQAQSLVLTTVHEGFGEYVPAMMAIKKVVPALDRAGDEVCAIGNTRRNAR